MMNKEERKKVDQEILAIGDGVTPNAVVDKAKDPKSALHQQFDWDDSSAATKYRLIHARWLIRTVTFVSATVSTPERSVKAPVFVKDPETRDQGYRMVVKVRDEKETAVKVMLSELQRVEACLVRAKAIADVLGLEKDLERLLKNVFRVRDKIRA